MMATDRLLEIEEKYGSVVERIVPVELDGEMLRVVLYLKDSSNLRITELWADKILKKYSYYWLNTDNKLKIGWDNAPHHTKIKSFPHHRHIGEQKDLQSSTENSLEDLMRVVLQSGTHV
jgi:hypothetical protein